MGVMKRDSRPFAHASCLGFSLILTFAGCGQNYSVDSSSGTVASNSSNSEIFDAKSLHSGQQVDMVLVIDNSGSMVEEAANVRKNIESFLSKVATRIDIHVALITALSSGSPSDLGVSLPPSLVAKGHVQLAVPIQSTNGPEFALYAGCPKGAIDGVAVCTRNTLPTYSSTIRGGLNAWFRAGAKRIYTFVTDDNSKLSSTDFLAQAKALNGGNDVTVYAFAGLGVAASPTENKPGTTYQEMAQATGGQVFNIAEKDWSANFDFFGTSVVEQFDLRLVLKAPSVKGITSVKVAGSPIKSDQYSFTAPNVITLKAAALAESGDFSVEVEFDPN